MTTASSLEIPRTDRMTWLAGVIACAVWVVVIGFFFRETLAALFLAPFALFSGTIKEVHFEKIPKGILVWNPPRAMRSGHSERILVRLGDRYTSIQEIHASLKKAGASVTLEPQVSPFMRVQLIGAPDFMIFERSSRDQVAKPGEITQWDFDVTPLETGQLNLRLLVSILGQVEGTDWVTDQPYDIVVEVTKPFMVRIGEIVKKYKWTPILVPLLIWAVNVSGLKDYSEKQIHSWLGQQPKDVQTTKANQRNPKRG